MKKKLVATSHGHAYSYWLMPDRYIYQTRNIDGASMGWLCSEPVWESTFSKFAHFDLVERAA